MNRVVWSPEAARDLEAIRDFVAQDAPSYAGLVMQRLVASVERLARFPESGRVVPELQRPDMREVVEPPFRVLYRVRDDLVEVVTVLRSSRLLRNPSE